MDNKFKWYPTIDRKGQEINPGDYASMPKYPKGTIRGRLKISDRPVVVSHGEQIPALVLETDDGVCYSVSSKVLKLKNQV